MAEEFLTLMADLDDESQSIISGWYEKLKAASLQKTSNKGIPCSGTKQKLRS